MRKLLFIILGFGFLAAAALVLWVARGPQPTEQRTTGGALYTQAQVAAQVQATGGAAPDLGAVVDVQSGAGPATIPLQTQFGAMAAADLQFTEPGELIAAAPTTTDQIAAVPGGVPLTTNVVLDTATQVQVAPLAAGGAAAPDGQGGMVATAAGYEQRVVELEWPATFQVGRAGQVRIKLKALEGGALQPVAEIADNEIIATPILLTDRYDTHTAFVTATISAPDFAIGTVSPATQPIERGQAAEWRWTLEASSAQTSIISLGLAITWEPKPGQPPGPVNVPIWGQTLQVEVDYVFGLVTVPQASIAGTVLAVLGVVAEIPLVGWLLRLGAWFLRLLRWIFFGGQRQRTGDRRNRR